MSVHWSVNSQKWKISKYFQIKKIALICYREKKKRKKIYILVDVFIRKKNDGELFLIGYIERENELYFYFYIFVSVSNIVLNVFPF